MVAPKNFWVVYFDDDPYVNAKFWNF